MCWKGILDLDVNPDHPRPCDTGLTFLLLHTARKNWKNCCVSKAVSGQQLGFAISSSRADRGGLGVGVQNRRATTTPKALAICQGVAPVVQGAIFLRIITQKRQTIEDTYQPRGEFEPWAPAYDATR